MESQLTDNNTLPRARDLGLQPGKMAPGRLNAITDVAGVRVGHCTVISGEGPLVPGQGPVRTGVTAVVPHTGNTFTHKVPAAVHVMNGFGKAAGFLQVDECGVLETPILLTNTLNVGTVADGLISYMLKGNPEIGIGTGTVNPVVAECNDGYLNDIQGRHVKPEHVEQALVGATGGPVAEGAVGAGTGMIAFGWKGGIGTASRQVPVAGTTPYTLGVLVLSNFGSPQDLAVSGWPVGRYLPEPPMGTANKKGDGSVVIIMATDAPLSGRQLGRVAARAVVGIVRCGSRLAHGSGDYAIAFTTAHHIPHTMTGYMSQPRAIQHWPDDNAVMAGLLRAAGEATEEAVLNSMLRAATVIGRDGHVGRTLPGTELTRIIARFTGSK